jgi:Ca2+-transporting ATPase
MNFKIYGGNFIMDYYLSGTESALDNLKTSKSGLTAEEAAKRLSENGRNELSKAKKKSIVRAILC